MLIDCALEKGNTELKVFLPRSLFVCLLWLGSLKNAVRMQVGIKYLTNSTHFFSILVDVKMLSIHLFLCLALEVKG